MSDSFTYKAPEQQWTDGIIEELKNTYNIIYDRGAFAIRRIPLPKNNMLFELLKEDDGILKSISPDHPVIFNSEFADSLINVLTKAKSTED
ncbi:MAG: hypothetical protein K6E34_12945 [Lachnospiraceae bacterium]|nr:hypothetical protein [Lachnospiraceae bacterium]